jgi:hypothetical protein
LSGCVRLRRRCPEEAARLDDQDAGWSPRLAVMNLLARLAAIEGCLVLLAFFGLVLFKIVIGEISLAGLLRTKTQPRPPPGGGESEPHEPEFRDPKTFSPARLQLLIFTVVVAAQYLQAVIANPQRDALPGLPAGLVAALGGSQAVYLGGKALSTFIQPLLERDKERTGGQ